MEHVEPLIQYSTVSDSVYLWIKNAIIQGDYKPGEHIPQESLTKKLGVSRTPVRDAIKRLEAEGLLITKPHCGAVVFQLTKKHLREIYELRILLEQYCAARTCMVATDEQLKEIEEIGLSMINYTHDSKTFMQLDRQFHALICSTSECANALEILDTLWNKSDSFKSLYYTLEGRVNDTLTDHAKIIQGLKKRDIEATKTAISDHLKDVVNSIASGARFE